MTDNTAPQIVTTAQGLLDLFASVPDGGLAAADYQGIGFELERFGRNYELTVADGDVLHFGDSLHSRIQAVQDLHFLALAQYEAPSTSRTA
jgi:hypothetical protein